MRVGSKGADEGPFADDPCPSFAPYSTSLLDPCSSAAICPTQVLRYCR
jgi:hypothetical protein